MDNLVPEDVIKSHFALCEEVMSLVMEENRILRSTGAPPEEEFLERKRTLLPRLDKSLDELRQVRESGVKLSETTRKMVEAAKNKLMKIFMIDRENEQLLLKATMPVARMGAMPVIHKMSPDKLRKAYGGKGL
jgi:ElaB/YqjD/DUF883 family membrane-anchored ribosome-binding protein